MTTSDKSKKPGAGDHRFHHYSPQRIGQLYQEQQDNEDALEQLIATGRDAFLLISLLDPQSAAGRILELQNLLYRLEREFNLLAALVKPDVMEDVDQVAEEAAEYQNGQE